MNQDKKVFDKEFVNKPIIFLKDVGRYCEICHKHIFGDPRKRVCSQKCRRRKSYLKNGKINDLIGVHAFISLKKEGGKRSIRIYLKKGIVEHLKIGEESKELWALLEKISDFRQIKHELVVTNA